MGPKFSISEVCSTSWQRTKAQMGFVRIIDRYDHNFFHFKCICYAYAEIHSGYNRYQSD